jgi:hypothetical protein
LFYINKEDQRIEDDDVIGIFPEECREKKGRNIANYLHDN